MTIKIRLKLPKDSYVHTKEGNEGHFINCKENRDENYIEVTREGLDVLLNDIFKSNKNPNVESRKLEKGSIATDWTPSPEDKINISDMRKPASDVAGIEDLDSKVNKADYTNDLNNVHTGNN